MNKQVRTLFVIVVIIAGLFLSSCSGRKVIDAYYREYGCWHAEKPTDIMMVVVNRADGHQQYLERSILTPGIVSLPYPAGDYIIGVTEGSLVEVTSLEGNSAVKVIDAGCVETRWYSVSFATPSAIEITFH